MTVTVTGSTGKVVARAANLRSPYLFRFSLTPGAYSVGAGGDASVIAHVRIGTDTHVTLRADCG